MLRLVFFSNVGLSAEYAFVRMCRCKYSMDMWVRDGHTHMDNKQTDGRSVGGGWKGGDKRAMAGQEERKRREEGLWSNRQGTRDRRQGRGCRRQYGDWTGDVDGER